MTTSVRVRHNGPGHHDVQVAITRSPDGVVVSTERLAEGDVKDFYVYDTQGFTVSEIPKREKQELTSANVGSLGDILGKFTGKS